MKNKIILEYIRVKNFKCFIQEKIFYYKKSSFIMITGDNGKGKSTLMCDAPLYALSDTVINALKPADSIIPEKITTRNKNLEVEFSFYINQDHYIIYAYRKHHKYKNDKILLKNNNDISGYNRSETNQIIADLLMPREIFINTFLFSQQYGQTFIHLDNTEKSKILDKLLGLDIYSNYRKKFADKKLIKIQQAKAIEAEIYTQNILKQAQQENNNKLEQEYNNLIKDLENKILQLQENIKQNESIEQDINLAEKILKLSQEYNSLYQKEKLKFEQKIADIEHIYKNYYNDYNYEMQNYTNEIKSLEKEFKKLDQECKIAKKELQTLQQCMEIDHVCMLCGQILQTQQAKDKISLKKQEFDKEIKALEQILQKIVAEKQNLQEKLLIIKDKIQELQQSHQAELQVLTKEKQEVLEQLEKNYQPQLQVLAIQEKKQLQVTNTVEQLQQRLLEEKNRYQTKLKEYQANLLTIDKIITEKTQQYDAMQAYLQAVEFWYQGFSNAGIKSMLMDEALPILNQTAQNLSQHTNVKVSFNTQKAKKDGEYKNEFSIEVIQTDNLTKDIKNLSAGERRLVDIIVLLSIRELLQKMSDIDMNVLILDEILDSLDPDNIQIVIQMLKKLSQNMTILLISHTFRDYIDADEVYTL